MPRKQSAILDYKLRIRETLRRRIEQAARKRGVSLNYEMAHRLERSFDQEAIRDIDVVRASLEALEARLAKSLHPLNMQGDLVRAVEALIKELPDEVRGGKAVARVQQVLKVIDIEAAQAVRRMHTN